MGFWRAARAIAAKSKGGSVAKREIITRVDVARDMEDLHVVQRFKYDVYVEEMGRYASIADHANRLLVERDDAASHNFLIRVGDDLAATMRLTWGGDGALHDRHIAQYDLAAFLDHVAPDQIVIGERFMIAPAFRGSTVLSDMFAAYMRFVNERRIQLIFGDCEPHLLNTYQAMGFRPYTQHNVNSPETGYLIPLVIVAEDVAHLRSIGSPLANVLQDFGPDARVPAKIDTLLAGGAAVKSEKMEGSEAFIADFKVMAAEANALESGLFHAMTEQEIAICLEKSVIIRCQLEDRVIKRGNVAKNMGMVLSGRFKVCDGDKTVAEIGPGDIFGEIAFFLKLPRTMDVVAITPGSRIISFNDRTIRNLIQSHSGTAAKLLYNISTTLCSRLNKTNELL